jgi:hypothetical protein
MYVFIFPEKQTRETPREEISFVDRDALPLVILNVHGDRPATNRQRKTKWMTMIKHLYESIVAAVLKYV